MHPVEIDYSTCRYDIHCLRVEHSAGDYVQSELAFVIDDGVSGIVSALIADYKLGILCQIVDDAAFALISPLETYNSTYII